MLPNKYIKSYSLVFVVASLSNVSVVLDSDVTTVTESVGVATPLAMAIVEVVGVFPYIPCGAGSSFHSVEPTGEVPSSGCVLTFTCVACLAYPTLAHFYHHIFIHSNFVI